MLPEEPEQFKELCEKVGLALMMGQKVQFSLAYYYSVYHIVNSGWSKEQAKDCVNKHLSKAMGFIVSSIEKDAALDEQLFNEIKMFKKDRNWLTHDFDEESTPYLYKNERFEHYIQEMDRIIECASKLMHNLNQVGEKLVPVDI
ncbi:hypothetical protein P4S54_10500 [Shewanella sp. PP-He15 brown]